MGFESAMVRTALPSQAMLCYISTSTCCVLSIPKFATICAVLGITQCSPTLGMFEFQTEKITFP